MISGKTGQYSTERKLLDENTLKALQKGVRRVEASGSNYHGIAHELFNVAAQSGDWSKNACTQQITEFQRAVLEGGLYDPAVMVRASPSVVTHIASVNGSPHVFIANYTGLIANKNSIQTAVDNVEVLFVNASEEDTVYYLPYLGEVSTIESYHNNFGLSASLPSVSRGGVVWLEKSEKQEIK